MQKTLRDERTSAVLTTMRGSTQGRSDRKPARILPEGRTPLRTVVVEFTVHLPSVLLMPMMDKRKADWSDSRSPLTPAMVGR